MNRKGDSCVYRGLHMNIQDGTCAEKMVNV